MIDTKSVTALDPAFAKPGSFLLAPGAMRSAYLAISHNSEIALVPLNRKEDRSFVVYPIAKGLGAFLVIPEARLHIDTDDIVSAGVADAKPGQAFVYADYKGLVVKSGYGTGFVTTEGQYLPQVDWSAMLIFNRWSYGLNQSTDTYHELIRSSL